MSASTLIVFQKISLGSKEKEEEREERKKGGGEREKKEEEREKEETKIATATLGLTGGEEGRCPHHPPEANYVCVEATGLPRTIA